MLNKVLIAQHKLAKFSRLQCREGVKNGEFFLYLQKNTDTSKEYEKNVQREKTKEKN